MVEEWIVKKLDVGFLVNEHYYREKLVDVIDFIEAQIEKDRKMGEI